MALGVEGPSSVAKILSNRVKRAAYRQKNGMVSQSTCDIDQAGELRAFFLRRGGWGVAGSPREPLVFTLGEAVHPRRAVYHVKLCIMPALE